MKKSKFSKILIITLILAMMLSNSTVYADAPSSWAQAEVDEARLKNLVISDADGGYQTNITRELFCRLIVNMVEVTIGAPVAVTIANPFNDTNDLDIIKAYQLEIVNGISATEFAPNNLITREEVAAMMMRAARKLDDLMSHNLTMLQLVGPPSFADLDQISGWALTDIREANALGIMNGIGGNQISPKGKTTIEQSILMILRLFNEYLPLMENAAPEQLPLSVVTFDVNEGESLDIQIADLASDADGDSLRVSGLGGASTTHGRLMMHTDYVTYTAYEVVGDQTSIWNVTITDDIESVRIDLTFNVIDVSAGSPVSNGVTSFTMNEGDTLNIKPSDIANDLEGDVMTITQYPLASGYVGEIGDILKYVSMIGNENSIDFTADWLDADTTTAYDIAITDGTNTSSLTIEINVLDYNAPPVAKPMITLHQDEGTSKIYFALTVATDIDGDTLEVIDYSLSALTQHDVGTPEIRNFDGAEYFYFTADEVALGTLSYWDLTISDGLQEVIVTIRIQVDNL